MSVRTVVTRSRKGYRGYFASQKTARMVSWESLGEWSAILLFEYSPGVVSYEEQPEEIWYPDGDRTRRYIPDFAITLGGEKVIHIEVKPADKLLDPKMAGKYRAIATHYQNQGRFFRLLTEQDIYQEPLFSQLKLLSRHRRPWDGMDELLPAIQRQLRDAPLPMHALALEQTTLLRLLAHGVLWCDLTGPLSPSTLISLAERGSHEQVLF